MQGHKQWCDNCKEVKGLHNDCPNLTSIGHNQMKILCDRCNREYEFNDELPERKYEMLCPDCEQDADF